MIRFVLPIFYEGVKEIVTLIVTLSIVAILYGGIMTIRQTDLKRLIAYSSVSHMGLVTLSLSTQSMEGYVSALLIMISHGFVSSGLFIAASTLYERTHSRVIRITKGLSTVMPLLALIFLMLTLASVGTPGSLNFLGEILVFSSFIGSASNIGVSLMALSSVVLSVVYGINLFNSVFLGQTSSDVYYIRELGKRETFPLFILTGLT